MAVEAAGVRAKYQRVLIAIVLAAVVITAGIITSPALQPTRTTTLIETTTKTTTTWVTDTIFAPLGRCEAAVKYTGLDSTLNNSIDSRLLTINNSFAILSMPTTSVGELCVTYYDADKNASKTLDLVSGGVHVGKYVSHSIGNGQFSSTFNQTSDVSVIATQSNITLGGSAPSQITIAYVIVTDGKKGFHFLNIGYLGPAFCAVEFPFAVGYTFTQANKTGPYFQNLSPFGNSCGIMLREVVYARVYGALGIQMTYVNCGAAVCDA